MAENATRIVLTAEWFSAMEVTIASVHTLPYYPVEYRRSSAKIRYMGSYEVSEDKADVIRVSAYSPSPHLTFAHETGHRVERRGLTAPNSVYLASWGDVIMTEWQQAVLQSRLIKQEMPYFERAGTEEEKRMVTYLASPAELWARSYAQYIALKSQKREMLSELKIIQEDIYNGDSVPFQWQDNDFLAISDTIDRLFQAKRWIR